MGDRGRPSVYSIAAHRGFADALVAGLFSRFGASETGLAELTLILPSSRSARTVNEAFIRLAGENGRAGLLMPRMVTIGDLDLDEALGNLLDPLSAGDIAPAVDPTRRWLELADILSAELGEQAPSRLGLLRLSREVAETMDRLLAEGVEPEALISEPVLDLLGGMADHWRASLRLFLGVQDEWLRRLQRRGEIDSATRRNLLFEHAAVQWRENPPETPIVAAGVTSAAPSLARLLRVIAESPKGSVVLPDLDLSLSDEAWDELGRAGQTDHPDGEFFGRGDALTHPQYHLKLLLNRMAVRREEVDPWHRKGLGAAAPARSHAISSLFLPPEASKGWVDLPADKRRLSGVSLLTSKTIEEEAQALALLVRKALEEPAKRVAIVTPDRALARRILHHLARWNIAADDTAGRPLSRTPAGRLLLLLAGLMGHGLSPINLIAALGHPLVEQGPGRSLWLGNLRAFERALRGPAPAPGLDPLRAIAEQASQEQWWSEVEQRLASLLDLAGPIGLVEAIDRLVEAVENLAGEAAWSKEDGRALAALVDDLRLHGQAVETTLELRDVQPVLAEAMEAIAIRPPYGGHPRVGVYGLLEARGARADLILCGGLNEGSWPQTPSPDTLLAPGILRRLGVPGAEFRIGLAAHDLAGAMGSPEVVLSRSQRDAEGPTIPSRFVLRVEALLGELAPRYRDQETPALLSMLDRGAARSEAYPRPAPKPSSEQRSVKISATALDRLLGDPYQFYAREILALRRLEALAADPFGDPALRGTLVHDILDSWSRATRDGARPDLVRFAEQYLRDQRVHPLFWGLWRPRIAAALERFERWIRDAEAAGRTIAATEVWGEMQVAGVKVHGIADRIDLLPDGSLAIIDYKTGGAPSAAQVEAGYALQLGVLGLIARDGQFTQADTVLAGEVSSFEYWSLARSPKDGEFGYVDRPIREGQKRSGLAPEEFLPRHELRLGHAIAEYIKGEAPFTAKANPDYPGYTDYDQLMRLEEWIGAQDQDESE